MGTLKNRLEIPPEVFEYLCEFIYNEKPSWILMSSAGRYIRCTNGDGFYYSSNQRKIYKLSSWVFDKLDPNIKKEQW